MEKLLRVTGCLTIITGTVGAFIVLSNTETAASRLAARNIPGYALDYPKIPQMISTPLVVVSFFGGLTTGLLLLGVASLHKKFDNGQPSKGEKR